MARRRPSLFRRMFVSQHRVRASDCPHCGARLEAATGISPTAPAVPTPGTLTLCSECERWLVFTDALGLRLATDDEIARTDATLRRLIRQSVAFFSRKVH